MFVAHIALKHWIIVVVGTYPSQIPDYRRSGNLRTGTAEKVRAVESLDVGLIVVLG